MACKVSLIDSSTYPIGLRIDLYKYEVLTIEEAEALAQDLMNMAQEARMKKIEDEEKGER